MKQLLVTRNLVADWLISFWKEKYSHFPFFDPILKEVASIEKLSPDALDEIYNKQQWTRPYRSYEGPENYSVTRTPACVSCYKEDHSDRIVVMHEDEDRWVRAEWDDMQGIALCKQCVENAVKLFKEAK